MSYYNKYLKYKNKYIKLKIQLGAANIDPCDFSGTAAIKEETKNLLLFNKLDKTNLIDFLNNIHEKLIIIRSGIRIPKNTAMNKTQASGHTAVIDRLDRFNNCIIKLKENYSDESIHNLLLNIYDKLTSINNQMNKIPGHPSSPQLLDILKEICEKYNKE